jgi:hypothetical protein
MGVMQGTVTSSIERHFPVNELSALARVERPGLPRPPLYLHKQTRLPKLKCVQLVPPLLPIWQDTAQ